MRFNLHSTFRALSVMAFALVFTSLMSCVNDDLHPRTDEKQDVTLEEEEFVPGIIHVKFEPEVGEAVEANLAAADLNASVGTRAFAGFPQLESLAENIKITEIRRAFPHAGKFEPRTRARGLHLWYDIYFEPEAGLTRAVQDFGQIEGIQIAEPQPVRKIIGYENAAPNSVWPIGGMIASSNTVNLSGTDTFGNGISSASDSGVSPQEATGSYPFNDPRLREQWHYINDGNLINRSLVRSDINVMDAWRKQTGHPDVIVSVVDMGIQLNHPDIAANIWINEAEQNGVAGVDDDNNGYIDDINGWNFNRSNNTIQPGFHGTHVAGTIAAVNNNGIGVSGIAGGNGNPDSGVRLMSCQVFTPNENPANEAGFGAAIKYGADNGAVISQNSWGGGRLSQYESDAIDYFIEFAGFDENGVQVGPMAGGIVIFAAGNENTRSRSYPAAYEPTVAVASIGPAYKRAYYSNYGDWVDIAAPGGDDSYGVRGNILSTYPNGQYAAISGTSMACPHVSGIAALMISEFGVGKRGYTASALKERLLSSVNDIEYYNTNYVDMLGSGMVDASKCLYDDMGIAPDPVNDLKYNWTNDESITLSWSLTADPDIYAASEYVVYVENSPISEDNISELTPYATVMVSAMHVIGDEITCKVNNISIDEPYHIGVAGKDIYGNRSALTVQSLNAEPPVQIKEFDDLYFGEKNKPVSFDLSEYFSDPDTDVLDYQVNINSETIVSATLEGSTLSITCIGWGTAEVTITATDGTTPISATFSVLTHDDINKPIELYPNPVSDKLHIRMTGDVNGNASVNLYNAAGMLAYSDNVMITPFAPGVVEVSGLARGTYTVVVTYAGKERTGTIVKI